MKALNEMIDGIIKQPKFKTTTASQYVINSSILEELQENIKQYAQTHIIDFIKTQNYNEIKEIHNSNNLFVDREFPATSDSVFYSVKFKEWLNSQNRLFNGKVLWKRASEISKNAKIASDKNGKLYDIHELTEKNFTQWFSTTDLDQGFIGNCWFVAAATGIMQNFDLFRKVMPFDNSFKDGEYTGLFHFRFWIYGTWYDVVVDDYLPVGIDNKLTFCHSNDNQSEFWCALLEKAYAKVYGSYEALEGGFTSDALVDMSGGVEETFLLNEIQQPSNRNKKSMVYDSDTFWQILLQARKKKSVICCNIETDSTEEGVDIELENGLVKGHAYVITALAVIPYNGNKELRLLLCHNPWGTEAEWKLDWSKQSPLWKVFSIKLRQSLLQRVKKKGQFWMSYTDWIVNFDMCQIVNLSPESFLHNNLKPEEYKDLRLLCSLYSTWQCYNLHSEWVKDSTAAGRGEQNPDKYWCNPQFLLIITQHDIVSKDNTATVIISLMQKNTRQKRLNEQILNREEYIQFRLFRITSKKAFLNCLETCEHFDGTNIERVGSSGAYMNKRQVTKRFNLKPGHYLIIPSTYDENTTGEFLLRVFSEKPLYSMSSNNDDNIKIENFHNYIKSIM